MLITENLLQGISDALCKPLNALNLNASFLDNGGDSLSLLKLHRELRRNDILLSAGFIFSTATLAEILSLAAEKVVADASTARQTSKRKLVANMGIPIQEKRTRTAGNFNTLGASRETDSPLSYPMTEMQFTLLRGSLRNPAMNLIYYYETHHPRNVPLLRAAWKYVTEAEPLLRCTYKMFESSAHLVEQNNSVFDWKEIMVSDNESFLKMVEKKDLDENFFKSSFRVVTLPETAKQRGKSRVIWRVHHCLVDGYSHNLLRSKIKTILHGGKVSPGIRFAPFVAGLHALQTTSRANGEAFWKSRHARCPQSVSSLPFPTITTSSTGTGDTNAIFELQVDSEILSKRCKDLGFTLPTLYHSAWALTLARYTGSREICFGTVLCGRGLPIQGIEALVGPTINTLPLHVQLQDAETFMDLMSQIFESLTALALHQWTTPEQGFSRDFHTALNIQVDAKTDSDLDAPQLDKSCSTISSEIPLQIEALEGGRLRLHYNTGVLGHKQVERIGQTFEAILLIPWNSTSPLEAYWSSNFEAAQRGDLSNLGNWEAPSTRTGSVKDDLVSLFCQAAYSNPSAIAVQKGAIGLTYSELHVQSNRIARHLSHLTESGSVVCVHADASLNWIIAIYGVLKAGCVYCPFGEDIPREMRLQNFATSGAKIFLATSEASKAKRPKNCSVCFSIEGLLQQLIYDPDPEVLHQKPDPSADAYLCFTSGSTGRPKGVICQHRGLVAFQSEFTVRLCTRPGWKVAQFMSPAFDGSIHEIFSALSYGATLLLKDFANPLGHLQQADAAILTPSVARILDPADFPELQAVYLVGEAVTQDVLEAWSVKTLYNMYGPTEATCGATIKKLLPNEQITLGAPNRSTRVYILDKQDQLSPRGVIGEIFLAGVQVSSGYLNRPDETAKRFLLDTIIPSTHECMYRTGDRGYWNDNGELVFLGRSDRQVKLRGFRIDMDDLEVRMLKASTEASSTAVTLDQDELVVAVIPSSLDLAKFYSEIATQVPSYAMPRRISAMDEFPMTSAGKLDYKIMGQTTKPWATFAQTSTNFTPMLSMVISSIEEVLGASLDNKIGPESDFVDLGATSMSLLRLSQRLSKVLARKVSVRDLLHHRTPQQLANRFVNFDDIHLRKEADILGESRVTPIEADWWTKYQANGETSAFNVNFVSTLDTTVDTQQLAKAWNTVLARHRILCCRYAHGENATIFRLYNEKPLTARLMKSFDIDLEVNTPFDLQEGSLVRVVISPSFMSVVISHIICDLTALNVLLREVADVYQGHELGPVKKQFSQVSVAAEPSAAHSAFWVDYLKDARAPASIQCASQKKSWAGTSHTVTISERLYARIVRFTATQRITMHQMALAAVAIALRRDDEVDIDVVIGAPYLNRNSEEDQDVVGLFLEPLPIRIKGSAFGTKKAQGDFLRAVQDASRSALSHAIPFNQLLSCLGLTPNYPNHPIFDVVVTFHETDRMPSFPVAGTKSVELWPQGAKFALLAEFSETRAGKLVLRLEYSTECFTESAMVIMGQKIERSLEILGGGEDGGEDSGEGSTANLPVFRG